MRQDPKLKRLGAALRWFREQKGISQEELADRAELHRTYIGGIERGERNPSFLSIIRIMKPLGITWNMLAHRLDTD